MNEMLATIEPKSDQLNADDLIGGRTITAKITKVHILAGDQPVAIFYEGDNGKPYRPCKTMRRVVVTVWGPDANKYVGRSMILYRDDDVIFAGEAVGGIRISHMSGIDNDVTMAVTVTRAKRKQYTVKPLRQPAAQPLETKGKEAAQRGMGALRAFWDTLSAAEKNKVGGQAQLESWKRTAADADRPADNGDPDFKHIIETLKDGEAAKQSRIPVDPPVQVASAEATPSQAEAGASDLQDLLEAARAAATNGKSFFEKWKKGLIAPDYERLKPHLDTLRNAAASADGERPGQ